jgi:hypothetical protein
MCLACEMEALWFAEIEESAQRPPVGIDAAPAGSEHDAVVPTGPLDAVTPSAASTTVPDEPHAESAIWSAPRTTKAPERKFICEPTSRE